MMVIRSLDVVLAIATGGIAAAVVLLVLLVRSEVARYREMRKRLARGPSGTGEMGFWHGVGVGPDDWAGDLDELDWSRP